MNERHFGTFGWFNLCFSQGNNQLCSLSLSLSLNSGTMGMKMKFELGWRARERMRTKFTVKDWLKEGRERQEKEGEREKKVITSQLLLKQVMRHSRTNFNFRVTSGKWLGKEWKEVHCCLTQSKVGLCWRVKYFSSLRLLATGYWLLVSTCFLDVATSSGQYRVKS